MKILRRPLLLLVLGLLGALALTNPNEAQYRGYIQEQQGIVGVLGIGLADLLTMDGKRGIHRDNYILFSKFYIGGDGLLPRQDLAWGCARTFFEIKNTRPKRP